jgi:predicted GNAT family acetyltransferase
VATRVTDNTGQQQFEIAIDGVRVGLAAYRRSHGRGLIAFIHTEIDDGHEGEGLGGRLVSAALDAARDQGLGVLPFCPFVRGYIEKHPEYVDLVPTDHREEFGLS